MYLRKRNFVNIYLILSFFFYSNYTIAKIIKLENIYLEKKIHQKKL